MTQKAGRAGKNHKSFLLFSWYHSAIASFLWNFYILFHKD